MTMAMHSHIPVATEELAPKASERILSPFKRFAQLSSAGGIVLLICTAIALVWANSGAADSYFALINEYVKISFGNFKIGHMGSDGHFHYLSAQAFINDALMAVFFLLVGLEIKREIIVGELSDIKKASLPIAAAIGGMIAPAGIYAIVTVMMNGGDAVAMKGWGVPMATDIAFALGILALLGKRVPNSLRIFLTSLAIADDLGALMVIAIFYTDHIYWSYLGYGAVIIAGLATLNALGFKRAAWYLVPGVVLWYCFLHSGVHATIAGVLLAATIPVNPRVDTARYVRYSRAALDSFERSATPDSDIKTNGSQRAAVIAVEENGQHVLPLLHRLEHNLHGWVAFFIIPVFALANAGLAFGGSGEGDAGGTTWVTLGIILGLAVGKPVGITAACWAAQKMGIASLPNGVTWKHIIGAGCLGGIGFTMAIFIAALGFKDPAVAPYLDAAKLGILIASAVSAIAGLGILMTAKAPEPGTEDAADLAH